MFDDPILQFVAEPENLALALEIADKVEEIRETHHRRFWQLVVDEFDRRLEQGELTENWVTVPFKGRLTGQYVGSYLTPRKTREVRQRFYVNVNLHQSVRNSRFRLYYGFKWSGSAIPDHPAVQALSAEVHRTKWKTHANWLAWDWLNYNATGNSFLVRMSQDPVALVAEVMEPLWDAFQRYKPLIDAMHEALAES